MKRKHRKIDINELNNKIVKRKMENPLYIPNELDLRFLNLPYMAKQMRKKKSTGGRYQEILRKPSPGSTACCRWRTRNT